MAPQPEVVVELANTIIRLKRELVEAENEWHKLFEKKSALQTATEISQRGGRSASEDSGRGRIRTLFAQDPNVDWTADRVSEFLNIPLGTTRTNLSKMVNGKQIEKRDMNSYGAIRAEKAEEATSEDDAS